MYNYIMEFVHESVVVSHLPQKVSPICAFNIHEAVGQESLSDGNSMDTYQTIHDVPA